jgi:hypothetical protein
MRSSSSASFLYSASEKKGAGDEGKIDEGSGESLFTGVLALPPAAASLFLLLLRSTLLELYCFILCQFYFQIEYFVICLFFFFFFYHIKYNKFALKKKKKSMKEKSV